MSIIKSIKKSYVEINKKLVSMPKQEFENYNEKHQAVMDQIRNLNHEPFTRENRIEFLKELIFNGEGYDKKVKSWCEDQGSVDEITLKTLDISEKISLNSTQIKSFFTKNSEYKLIKKELDTPSFNAGIEQSLISEIVLNTENQLMLDVLQKTSDVLSNYTFFLAIILKFAIKMNAVLGAPIIMYYSRANTGITLLKEKIMFRLQNLMERKVNNIAKYSLGAGVLSLFTAAIISKSNLNMKKISIKAMGLASLAIKSLLTENNQFNSFLKELIYKKR